MHNAWCSLGPALSEVRGKELHPQPCEKFLVPRNLVRSPLVLLAENAVEKAKQNAEDKTKQLVPLLSKRREMLVVFHASLAVAFAVYFKVPLIAGDHFLAFTASEYPINSRLRRIYRHFRVFHFNSPPNQAVSPKLVVARLACTMQSRVVFKPRSLFPATPSSHRKLSTQRTLQVVWKRLCARLLILNFMVLTPSTLPWRGAGCPTPR